MTHELSHAHLQQWMPTFRYPKTPSWFLEGVATFLSQGGGAEAVTDDEARAEIRRGHHFTPVAEGSLLFPRTVKVDDLPVDRAYPLAYRQASLFIEFLLVNDPAQLARIVDRLIDDKPFPNAFAETFGRSIEEAWRDFVAQL